MNFKTASKLDFIQLCSIAHGINEAFEQFARHFYHVGFLYYSFALFADWKRV